MCKKSMITTFYDSPLGEEPIEANLWGTHENNFSEQENKMTQSGSKRTSLQRGNPNSQEIKKIFKLLNLKFFHELSRIKNNLLELFIKLSDTQYINGINLSNYNLTNSEISVLSKGLAFCPTSGPPDIGNIIQDMDILKRR